MKYLFLLGFLLMTTTVTKADSLTFTLLGANVDGRAITPAQANGHWLKFDGFEVKLMADGNPGFGDEVGIFWTNSLPYTGATRDILVSLNARICVAGSCGNTTISGALTLSPSGLTWKLPPAAYTFQADDGSLIGITSRVYTAPGTTDLDISGRLLGGVGTTATPEPATLTLLGLGLALGARRLRRKSQ